MPSPAKKIEENQLGPSNQRMLKDDQKKEDKFNSLFQKKAQSLAQLNQQQSVNRDLKTINTIQHLLKKPHQLQKICNQEQDQPIKAKIQQKPKFSFIVSQEEKRQLDKLPPKQDDLQNQEYIHEDAKQNEKQATEQPVFQKTKNLSKNLFAPKKTDNPENKKQQIKTNQNQIIHTAPNQDQKREFKQNLKHKAENPFNSITNPQNDQSKQAKQSQRSTNPFASVKSRWDNRRSSSQYDERKNQMNCFELLAKSRDNSQKSNTGSNSESNSTWGKMQPRGNWLGSHDKKIEQEKKNTIWDKKLSDYQKNKSDWNSSHQNSWGVQYKRKNDGMNYANQVSSISQFLNLYQRENQTFKSDEVSQRERDISIDYGKAKRSFLDDPKTWKNRGKKGQDQQQELFTESSSNYQKRRW